MRRAARVDTSQEEIIKALAKCGFKAVFIGKPLDLIVSNRHRTFLLECKTKRPTSEGGEHGLTDEQTKFLASWPGEWHIVKTPEQAVAAAVGKEAMK